MVYYHVFYSNTRERHSGVTAAIQEALPSVYLAVTTTQLRESAHQGGRAPAEVALTAAGAGLLFATGAIHLDLYLTGYRSIPTIGWMFLLQVVSGFALGLALAIVALSSVTSDRLSSRQLIHGASLQVLVTVGGAVFVLTTLAGYLLSLSVGLFGFTEIRTQAGITAGILEIAAFVSLSWAAPLALRPPARPARMRLVLSPLAVAAVALLIAAEAGATAVAGPPASNPKPAPGGSEVTVVIKNFAFHPAELHARPGEKILVKNEDSVAHTFSTRPGAAADVAFTTGAIGPGTSRVVAAPSQAGSYPFQCLIHPFMTGTLLVSSSG
jgi:plastocyanin